MSTFRERIDRIHREIPIQVVLSDLGYFVRPDGGHREQQFPCDLHGDGSDGKPSARVYPDSSSWYCFACSKSRDAIDTLRARENLDLRQAIRYLERKYGLPDLPWSDDVPQVREDTRTTIKSALATPHTFQDGVRILRGSLDWITAERVLSLEDITLFWEALDQVVFKVDKGQLPDAKAGQILQILQQRLDKAVSGDSP